MILIIFRPIKSPNLKSFNQARKQKLAPVRLNKNQNMFNNYQLQFYDYNDYKHTGGIPN